MSKLEEKVKETPEAEIQRLQSELANFQREAYTTIGIYIGRIQELQKRLGDK